MYEALNASVWLADGRYHGYIKAYLLIYLRPQEAWPKDYIHVTALVTLQCTWWVDI